jgi:hypothetical protein
VRDSAAIMMFQPRRLQRLKRRYEQLLRISLQVGGWVCWVGGVGWGLPGGVGWGLLGGWGGVGLAGWVGWVGACWVGGVGWGLAGWVGWVGVICRGRRCDHSDAMSNCSGSRCRCVGLLRVCVCGGGGVRGEGLSGYAEGRG